MLSKSLSASRCVGNVCRTMATTTAKGRRLEGKVVLATAATQGLGLAATRRMAEEGAKVMICSRKQANVDEALKTLQMEGFTGIKGMQCHVSDEGQRQRLVDKTVEEFGGIDSLVHCAGISPCPGPVLTNPSESFDKIFEVNVKSALEMTKLVRPHMNARKGGTLVFLSSTAAYQTTGVMLGLYAVAKLALHGLMKEIAKEVVDENIRSNCIAAGAFETKYAKMLKTENVRRTYEQSLIMKRMGEPDELAGAVVFLISDDSSYITGEVINIAGGVPSRV